MGKRPLPVEKQARAASRRAAREAQRDYQALAATSRRIFAALDKLPLQERIERARALLADTEGRNATRIPNGAQARTPHA